MSSDFGAGQPGAQWQPPQWQPDPPPPPQQQPGQFDPGSQPASEQFRQQYTPQQPWPGTVMPRRTNSLAIAALCCGIGQVIAGPLAGVPAIILGFMSMRQIRQTGEDGNGMAVTGLVLGIIGVIASILLVVVLVALVAHVTAPVVTPGGP